MFSNSWRASAFPPAGWLAVRAPIGSRVVVEADGRVQTGWVSQESSYGAGKPPLAWFGLGSNSTVDAVLIDTPGGASVAISGPLPARRTITLAAE